MKQFYNSLNNKPVVYMCDIWNLKQIHMVCFWLIIALNFADLQAQ